MEVWNLIEEDHRRLEALACQLERHDHDEKLAREFKHALIANLEAEDQAVYRVLYPKSGFKQRISDVLVTDTTLRKLAEELDAVSAHERVSLIPVIKGALAEHVRQDKHIIPVAKKELPHHMWEHLKHEYESAKHAEIRRLTGKPASRAEIEHSEMMRAIELALASNSAGLADRLERLGRREHAHVFATRAALDRSDESNHRSLFGEIAEHHLRYANDLGELLASVDGDGRRIKRRVSAGWARVLASAFVSEKALLKAVRTNEEHACRDYDGMLRESAPEAVRKILHTLVEKGHEHIAQIDAAITAWVATGEHRSPPEPLQSHANASIHRA